MLEDRDLWDMISGDVNPEHCLTFKDKVTYKRKGEEGFCDHLSGDGRLAASTGASSLVAYNAWTTLVMYFEKKSLANKLFYFVVSCNSHGR
uniref:Uncharacterized protein n=1 Tax=Peronospora matthiolae TaxID=2874970 RepID=A0AAV1VBT0_9STRA